MLSSAAESMAGRVGIIDLSGLSLYEYAQMVPTDGQEQERVWLPAYLAHPESVP